MSWKFIFDNCQKSIVKSLYSGNPRLSESPLIFLRISHPSSISHLLSSEIGCDRQKCRIFARDMSRILAIDYGQKRTGLAVTDPLQIIANGLTTVPTAQLEAFVVDYVKREEVERIVVGLPRQNSGEYSENMRRITPFVNRLKKVLPGVPVEMVDERFTSVIAHRTMLEAGLKKKDRQNKALVDEISACIILQSYMESRRFGGL